MTKSGRDSCDLAVVLLAAGKASRFGSDKLNANLSGRTVLERSMEPLRRAPFARRIIVRPTAVAHLPIGDFETITTPDADLPVSASIGAGCCKPRPRMSTPLLVSRGGLDSRSGDKPVTSADVIKAVSHV